MKRILVFVLVALCLCVGAAYAADDSDFIGEWVLKSMFFESLGFEADAENLGISGSLTITKNKIITDSNGEITEAEWFRKSDDVISIKTETGDMDFTLEGGALVTSGKDANGNITRMKFAKPGTTCNCEELQKRIEELEAEIETLKAAGK